MFILYDERFEGARWKMSDSQINNVFSVFQTTMKQFVTTILSNRSICSDFFEMTFSWDDTVSAPLPGQFFTVRISRDTVPLLRRPFAFSAFDAAAATASMIYQKRGRGTEMLTGKKKGDFLDVLGPLGKAFSTPDRGKKALLVAGGIGLGPVMFLASAIKSQGVDATMIFGCRNVALIPSTDTFHNLSPVICTDDGSSGFKGTTGDYLASIESSITAQTHVFACGPMPMLKACHDIALLRGCGCFVSVEQVMACGVGACMGCAIRMASGGFKRACIEGPVFDSRDIQW
jgi:dihydroorotate dehydrogenase electron transfer subunit